MSDHINDAQNHAEDCADAAKVLGKELIRYADEHDEPTLTMTGEGFNGLWGEWVKVKEAIRAVGDSIDRAQDTTNPEEAREVWREVMRSTTDFVETDSDCRKLYTDAIEGYNNFTAYHPVQTTPDLQKADELLRNYMELHRGFDKHFDSVRELAEQVAEELEVQANDE